MYKALTIAGSDSSGGAGIQADLKTFQEHGVYGMSSLTTIVTMDPKDWSHHAHPMDLETVKKQVETATSVEINALKTGMLGSPEIIEYVAEIIDEKQIKNIVIDPVMVCKGTDEVLHPENLVSLRNTLVPKATVTTPNLFEAAKLADQPLIKSEEELKEAARKIHSFGAKYVLIKAGNLINSEKAIDLLYDGEEFTHIEAAKVDTANVHGAGCTYAAAITAQLAKGKQPKEAIEAAKRFITKAVQQSFKFNSYVGPVFQKGALDE
ncbi:pyridoxine/pyridoxal/pyridoxamine kinase [Bacillus tianshenii]|nr:pyridoxine/pyridoxal/pyridoxamine kinase [Bacillus tianshenii]